MADTFRPVLEGMKQVADGLIRTNNGLIEANAGLVYANEGYKKLADALLATKDEHEDLRETVGRLESLVIAQGQELRALRDRLDR